MNIFYFETSAVNSLAAKFSLSNATLARQLQFERGMDWCISPVTLVEILQTADPLKRDYLIQIAQRLFSPEMMASPEETIIHYISSGCPEREPKNRLKSQTKIAQEWKHVVKNPDRTLYVDEPAIKKRQKALKQYCRIIHTAIRDIDEISVSFEEKEAMKLLIDSCYNNLRIHQSGDMVSDEHKNIYKLAVIYLITVICYQLGPCPEVTEKLWDSLGISSDEERVLYALTNWEEVIYKGPLNTLANMAYVQSGSRFSRGVYYDSLHILYINYSDLLYTADSHFMSLKERFIDTPYYERIGNIDEYLSMNEECT